MANWLHNGGDAALASYGVDVAGFAARPVLARISAAFPDLSFPPSSSFRRGAAAHGRFRPLSFRPCRRSAGLPSTARTPTTSYGSASRSFSDADFGRIVVHGHTPVDRPEVRPNRINIDTGAVSPAASPALCLRERRGASSRPAVTGSAPIHARWRNRLDLNRWRRISTGPRRIAMSKILVTGGAGYIGSHCCKALAEAGFEPVAFDNLHMGHARRSAGGPHRRRHPRRRRARRGDAASAAAGRDPFRGAGAGRRIDRPSGALLRRQCRRHAQSSRRDAEGRRRRARLLLHLRDLWRARAFR